MEQIMTPKLHAFIVNYGSYALNVLLDLNYQSHRGHTEESRKKAADSVNNRLKEFQEAIEEYNRMNP